MAVTFRNMATIYLLQEDKMLLLYRQGSRVVSNVWTGSAGGHMEPEEIGRPEACMLREMQEELGLLPEEISTPRLRYVAMRLVNGEIRQNYYYFAQLKTCRKLSSNEGSLQWFALNELSGLPMPCTARWMINHWLSTGRYTDCIYGGIAESEGMIFTPLQPY